MTTKLPLKKILKAKKKNITTKRQEILNLKKRADKNSESSIDLAAHTKIIK
jgi:hypothetical protein